MDFLSCGNQEVVSNILKWCNNSGSKLIVITTANSMDWLERVVTGPVTSTNVDNRCMKN